MTETGAAGPQLTRRMAEISAALDLAGERIDPGVVARAREDLAHVARRVELGVDYTVVALVGGTGSGKSSLFNAISGLRFADVGVIRPTTSEAAACVWGSRATALLDFLQVAPTRRIQRESELDADDEEALHGLVLLDLPDHDSVESDHAEQVNRLLPLIDLLVWVVDPQKYADNVLHERYLRALTARHEAMVVIINQVDTIPQDSHERVLADVRRLLVEDGLEDVRIRMASARTGEGVAELRQALAEVIAGESIGARTARDELAAISARLQEHLGAGDPVPPAVEATAEQLGLVAGVPSVAESIRKGISSPRRVALSPVQQPARSRVEAIRDRWLADATEGLPDRWHAAVTADVPTGAAFDGDVWRALSAEPLPAPRDDSAARVRLVGLLAAWLGTAATLAGIVLLLLGQTTTALAVGGAGLVVMVAGTVAVVVARRRRRTTAVARSEEYLAGVHGHLAEVVRRDLAEPTAGPLAEHADVLRGVRGA